MISQSSRLYLERAGILPTRRSLHRPTLDASRNLVQQTPAVLSPSVQLALEGGGSPDRAGTAGRWPNEEVQTIQG